ncbi:UDP-N,N'-diacetylbacillosamine 2-epimerase (hydrolyzing) [Thiomonas sp. X19]|uniref:UDP-N-acetylglucosamine 2-epimerase n=1 Tax=Thiomonas sp. X19 TaxID=1050370 RepID=UPI000B6BE475|nr:UDP-N-acetylglucosamine 2-epimerase [Thiomonas sp. X19]SCC93105.1 UDP-N,N'-diacetylbacillosamine 2-epimerase (hydrolyzing) [Thiomonas sp. X19]
MTRRILYLSGTRADFGLMQRSLRTAAAHPALDVAVAVTGMHLHPDYGHTVDEIAASGLALAARIPSDVQARDRSGMARAVGQTLLGLVDVLAAERPDALLLLGDRGEMLAGATAALHLGVPAIHIHGGERSGTVDEAVRHAISKLAALHFCATTESRERLIAMGEEPRRVHVVGAPGLDDLGAALTAPRASALDALGLKAGRPYALVVFHPVVQEAEDAAQQTGALLEGLRAAGAGTDFDVIWLAPNADAGSGHIVQALEAQRWPGLKRITHLPRPAYLAALRHAAVLVGNSSSGIIEAASFGTPAVNVGTRQNLRERNANTADVPVEAASIATAVRTSITHGPWPPHNVYGDGQTAARIAHLLATLPLSADLLHKVNRY